MIILAMFISVLLNDSKLKFKGFFRTAIFLPALPRLLPILLFSNIYLATEGLVNQLLFKMHLITRRFNGSRIHFGRKLRLLLQSHGAGQAII